MTGTGARPIGAVLAGGASRRFGRDKAGSELAGRPMAAWAVAALRGRVSPLFLVGGEAELARRLGVTPLPDRRPGRGPLAGLEAALLRAVEEGAPGAFVLACDLPLVTGALVEEVLAMAGDDAAVPETPGAEEVQPLCACYPASALAEVRTLLDREPSPSVGDALDAISTRRVSLDRIRGVGDPEELFLNVNTPEAAERARRLLLDRSAAPESAGPASGADR